MTGYNGRAAQAVIVDEWNEQEWSKQEPVQRGGGLRALRGLLLASTALSWRVFL